jgi:hypothetical protein
VAPNDPKSNVVDPGIWGNPARSPPERMSDNGGEPPDMNERLNRLEIAVAELRGAIDGLRHGQNVALAVMALIVAIGLYALTRIDSLPADFERMNQTLSAAITASKQSPPQVILIPAPKPREP